jgi:hypothetical protein
MQQTNRSLLLDRRRRRWKHWWIGCLLAFLVVNMRCTTDTWAAADQPKSEKSIAVFSGLQLQNGLLTAHVTATPLPQVLSEMSRLSGVRVVWLGHPDNRQVSVTFTALPVAEAIERVLGANNFLLVYASTVEKARLKEIWVATRHFPTQTVIPPALESAPMTQERTVNDNSTELTQESEPTTDDISAHEVEAELAKMLESQLDTAVQGTDRDHRIEAIGFLGGLVEQDSRIRPLLQQLSISERDPQVRTAAAEVLAEAEE